MKTVCFTGFDKPQATYLKALAEQKRIQVLDAVIPSLSFLVAGPTPRRELVLQADRLGVPKVDLQGFWDAMESARGND